MSLYNNDLDHLSLNHNIYLLIVLEISKKINLLILASPFFTHYIGKHMNRFYTISQKKSPNNLNNIIELSKADELNYRPQIALSTENFRLFPIDR